MILVDTSVWVDHLRVASRGLGTLLDEGDVLCHPFVIGELACGNLANRAEVLRLLAALPQAPRAADAEVLAFVEGRRLEGRGLGYIDVHLLAAALLAGSVPLWTLDRRLASAARELGVAYVSGSS